MFKDKSTPQWHRLDRRRRRLQHFRLDQAKSPFGGPTATPSSACLHSDPTPSRRKRSTSRSHSFSLSPQSSSACRWRAHSRGAWTGAAVPRRSRTRSRRSSITLIRRSTPSPSRSSAFRKANGSRRACSRRSATAPVKHSRLERSDHRPYVCTTSHRMNRTDLAQVASATLFLAMTACGARSHIVARNPALTLAPTCADAVPVYPSDKVPYDYYEIALISAEGNSVYTGNGDLLKSVRKQAARVGANGVVVDSLRATHATV